MTTNNAKICDLKSPEVDEQRVQKLCNQVSGMEEFLSNLPNSLKISAVSSAIDTLQNVRKIAENLEPEIRIKYYSILSIILEKHAFQTYCDLYETMDQRND